MDETFVFTEPRALVHGMGRGLSKSSVDNPQQAPFFLYPFAAAGLLP
jgi:hypothetical protein